MAAMTSVPFIACRSPRSDWDGHGLRTLNTTITAGRQGGSLRSFRREIGFDHPAQPVAGPSWFDAVAYCEWLTRVIGPRFRLPTEAEWEWAARAGLPRALYPWGDSAVIDRDNYYSRWRTGPEPVATSLPNDYGLFDMCENVHEWCSDGYDAHYYSVSPIDDPPGASRCAGRSSIPPAFEYADYGFRIASDLD
jgi:formylglycine-generating enzyme required for sulfatase activity